MKSSPAVSTFLALLVCTCAAFANDGHGAARDPRAAKTLVDPVATTPMNLTAGETLYQRHCAGCHGPDGTSNTPLARKLKQRPVPLVDYRMDSLLDGEVY